MKKGIRYVLFLSIFIMIGLAGCNSEISGNRTGVTPEPTKGNFFADEEKTGNDEEESRPLITIPETVLQEALEKKDASEEARYNAINRMDLPFHNDSESLFCIDGESGAVYFVNQNQDYYIYRLKDGEAELAVALPARELYMQDGVLYFVLETHDVYRFPEGMYNGDIYSYSPEAGTIDLVYAAGKNLTARSYLDRKAFMTLTVTEDGIYFIGEYEEMPYYFEEWNKWVYVFSTTDYFLAFGEEEPIIDTKRGTRGGWRDYYLYHDYETADNLRLVLQSRNDDSLIVLCEGEEIFDSCGIMDDMLYALRGENIIQIDLLTMESTTHDFKKFKTAFEIKYAWANGYIDVFSAQVRYWTMTMESIIIADGGDRIYVMNRESGEIECYFLQEMNHEGYHIERLYTDGEHIYILTEKGVSRVLTESARKNESYGCYLTEEELLVNVEKVVEE